MLFRILLVALVLGGCESPAVTDGLMPINGTELYVKQMGAGEPIVVVHGGPVLEHGYLLPHLAPLADDYRLIFFDQRLSGRSAAQVDSADVTMAMFVEDIEQLRTELGLGTIHLMGHSWGGQLAMRYAMAHPEALRSLVLLDPMPPSVALWQQEEAELSRRDTPADSAARAAIMASDAFQARDPDAIRQLLLLSFKPQFYNAARLDSLHLYVPPDYMDRSARFGYLWPELSEYDLLPGLADVRTPTLILYGDNEPAASISGIPLERTMPNARLVTIPASGHFPFIENRDAFFREVRAFLTRPER
ncbi:MAG: alpha/beta fold hydrolase [Rhodothermales bacterium]